MKGQSGITLVALVITVIVMLILAGVAITLLDDTSLFGEAENAADRYNYESDVENQVMTNWMNYVDKQVWNQTH